MQCRVLGDFNELMVLPMFGYSSMEHVFKDGSPHLRVQSVTTPILALNAQDDPFCPAHSEGGGEGGGGKCVVIWLMLILAEFPSCLCEHRNQVVS